MADELEFTLNNARYAKKRLALRIPGIDGWKSLAALIFTQEIAPNARYSNRERAYIVSRAQADRFIQAIDELKARREGNKANAQAE